VSRGLRAGATTDGNPGGNTLAYWGQEKPQPAGKHEQEENVEFIKKGF